MRTPDAYSLGIRNDSTAQLDERFPERRGQGELGRQLAEMVAKVRNVPFRRDQLKKKLQMIARKGDASTCNRWRNCVWGWASKPGRRRIESRNIRECDHHSC